MRKSITYIVQFFFVLFCNQIFAYSPAEAGNFRIVTCASKSTKNLEQLLVSAQYYGVDVEILGLGQPYKGNGRKFRYYLDYLKTVPDNDIILFIDAYDIIILADKKTILDTFYKMNVPILVAAEAYCFPFKNLANQFPRTPSRFKYLNCGGIIGYAGYMKKLFSDLPPFADHHSDQGVITKHYLSHLGAYQLDYNAEMFICLQDVFPNELICDPEKKKVYSRISAPYPCIVHGNGLPSKPHYQAIYDELFPKTCP